MNGKENSRRASSIFSGACFIIVMILAVIFCPSEAMVEVTVNQGPLSPFNGEQLKKLRAGEPVCVYRVDSALAGYGQCSIILNATIEKCFKLLSKIENQVYYVPGKKKSKIIKRDEDKILVENEYIIFGVTIRYYSIYTLDQKKYRIKWEIDKSKPHDLADNSGFYQFEKIDEKTSLLTYGATKFEVGISVPEFIKKYLLDKSMPAMAINIKKYIESDGTWRQ